MRNVLPGRMKTCRKGPRLGPHVEAGGLQRGGGILNSKVQQGHHKEGDMNRKALSISCLVLALILAAVSTAAAAGKGKHSFVPDISKGWTQIFPDDVDPDFVYNGLKPSCAACPGCNGQFSFFVKGGRTNNLVIYFQGGGACWDSMNCLYVHTYYEETPSISMFSDTSGKGIFDGKNPNNPFRDWYFVYIPYCTGDIHWGANDVSYPDYMDQIPGFDSWTIRHRGFVNFQLVLEWISENFRMPFKVFVTGSSAGGYGAVLGFPYIKEAYPHSQVYLLGDAANGVVGEQFMNASIYNWNIQIPRWIPGFESGYTPDMKLPDLYLNIAHFYRDSKLGQFTTAYDNNQTFFYNVMLNISNPYEWNNISPVWCDWHATMYDYAHDTAMGAKNYRYYIAAGDYHTILMSPKFYTEDSAGVSFAKWVKMMVENPLNRHGGPPGGKWQNVECTDCQTPAGLTCP